MFYGEVQEYFPENAPEARGKSVTMTQFVDVDHVGEMMNRRSHTGIFVYLCRYLIMWYSKNQNTVKSSTFISEVVDMRT